MQRTIRLNLDLSFVYGPRTWRAPLVAVMLLCAVGELNSESVTLSTYYPAPSGVYTNMITTGNTFLARDGAGTKVGIGTTAPGGKLSIAGNMSVGAAYATIAPPANGMIVSGRLGVGNSAPSEALDVVGNAAVAGNVSVVGNISVAAGGGANGYIKIDAAGCSVMAAAVANGALCGPGKYATFMPGVYTVGMSYQNIPSPFLILPDGVSRIYRFVGINPANGQQSAMATGYEEAIRVSCCPR